MRWCVIYSPDLDSTAVIAEDSLEHYRNLGWRRVTEWADNSDDLKAAVARGETTLVLDADLDAPEPEPTPAKKAAAKQDKENS